MKRREFFEKTGSGAAGLLLAHFGLKAGTLPLQTDEQKEKIKKLLAKMGKSEEEIAGMMKDMEEMHPMFEEQCICRNCPTYVSSEDEDAFCHAFVSKSDVINEEKGCHCPDCPVHKKLKMKNGYYCTRMSELEQEAAKKT